jgi:hypothetical protein
VDFVCFDVLDGSSSEVWREVKDDRSMSPRSVLLIVQRMTLNRELGSRISVYQWKLKRGIVLDLFA